LVFLDLTVALAQLAPLTVKDDSAQAMAAFAANELDEGITAHGFIFKVAQHMQDLLDAADLGDGLVLKRDLDSEFIVSRGVTGERGLIVPRHPSRGVRSEFDGIAGRQIFERSDVIQFGGVDQAYEHVRSPPKHRKTPAKPRSGARNMDAAAHREWLGVGPQSAPAV
jgi:hypothetical protein